jgi:hypothetical protein
VFVYRDTSDQPGGPAATGPGPGENDADYWYDLPGTDAGTDAPAHVVEETRGPFEPLVSSADPRGMAPGAAPDAARPDQAPDAAGPDHTPVAAGPDHTPVAGAPDGLPEETAHDRARKLEQIKDLYLTAEAIGEANVDKHFDQLLAQQRQLISDYFRQPGMAGPGAAADSPPAGMASRPAGAASPPAGAASPPAGAASQSAAAVGAADQAETEPGALRDPGPHPPGPRPPGPAAASEGARAAADPPRVW